MGFHHVSVSPKVMVSNKKRLYIALYPSRARKNEERR